MRSAPFVMVRTLVYLLLTIFLITIVRAVVGLIGKAVGDLFQPSSPRAGGRETEIPVGGELKQDPVCGIYVSTETKIRKTVNGKTYYFCSESCRDKFKG